jgi:hypothetical protein
MAQWVLHSRSLTLDEMIRLEGRGSYAQSICIECFKSQPTLRCEDCFGGELFCEECCVKLHVRNPLHNITVFISGILFNCLYLFGAVALEWYLLRTCQSEVSRASHPTWPPPWKPLHKPKARLRGRFRHHRFTWNSRSRLGLLQLRSGSCA